LKQLAVGHRLERVHWKMSARRSKTVTPNFANAKRRRELPSRPSR
jgi:uncharacterized protein (DUF58 family)